MRLWHKDLISILPKQQLCGQWRECCLIAKQISEKGIPNHILVNKIMNYSIDHFITYSWMIKEEMCYRGYKCDWQKFINHFIYNFKWKTIDEKELFKDWHNSRYLNQCYCNLEEKYDCGGIPQIEWNNLYYHYWRMKKEMD
jgi:uncharacterized protein (TIGR02328 family)